MVRQATSSVVPKGARLCKTWCLKALDESPTHREAAYREDLNIYDFNPASFFSLLSVASFKLIKNCDFPASIVS